jgi:hypothetical protein
MLSRVAGPGGRAHGETPICPTRAPTPLLGLSRWAAPVAIPGDGPAPAAPSVPAATTRIPVILLWFVPFVLVIGYVVLVATFFHDQARWSGVRVGEVTLLLLLVTFLFSILWYAYAYGVALLLGELVPAGVLLLVSRIPGIHRHVVVAAPSRPDTTREVWGRFAILFLVLVAFELIFMIVVVRRGDLNPGLVLGQPVTFFRDEAISGLLLATLIAPAGAFLGSRVRLRITDSLPFPLLWLAALLVVVGGLSVLTADVLPGAIVDPGLFLTSVLFYAPAAWFVALAFSRSEWSVQSRFLRRAWNVRGGRFHFGHLQVKDDPEGTTNTV